MVLRPLLRLEGRLLPGPMSRQQEVTTSCASLLTVSSVVQRPFRQESKVDERREVPISLRKRTRRARRSDYRCDVTAARRHSVGDRGRVDNAGNYPYFCADRFSDPQYQCPTSIRRSVIAARYAKQLGA